MARHSPEAVANKFLDLADERGVFLTPMQLHKLVYIAHGWSLALTDKGLVSEPPQAWKWGPVYPSLYNNTKRYGSGPVFERICHNNWALLDRIKGAVVEGRFDSVENGVIEKVFDEYGDLEAFQLSALTHNEGTPWSQVFDGSLGKDISNSLIKNHFLQLAE